MFRACFVLQILCCSKPNTVQFCVQDLEPAEYGNFLSGEAYLLLYPEQENALAADRGLSRSKRPDTIGADGLLGWSVLWWIGEDSPIDKGAIAAMKAVELSKVLTGHVKTHFRQFEGEEGLKKLSIVLVLEVVRISQSPALFVILELYRHTAHNQLASFYHVIIVTSSPSRQLKHHKLIVKSRK